MFTVSRDLAEGELDLVANKKISHLTECFLHTSECISTYLAAKTERLDLNERYSRALKACHDTPFYLSHNVQDFSSTSAARVEVEKLRGGSLNSAGLERKSLLRRSGP